VDVYTAWRRGVYGAADALRYAAGRIAASFGGVMNV
jgi:hypothetical protein